jgi:hypothetical protein
LLRVEQLPGLVFDEGMFFLLSAMLARPKRYRKELGGILSQINIDLMPIELKDKLKPYKSGLDFSLESSYENWYLCDTSEPNLIQSVEDKTAMAIGTDSPYFLLKFQGRLTALCLQNIITQEGRVFISGNWYSPTDNETINVLGDAFDAGTGRIDLQKGNWVMMRPLERWGDKTVDNLLDESQEFANTIPDHYPRANLTINGVSMTRSQFRIRNSN